MSAQVCNHGFWLSHCALCRKLPSECDYGNCVEPFTTTVDYVYRGRLTERRRACAAHVPEMEKQVRRLAGEGLS